MGDEEEEQEQEEEVTQTATPISLCSGELGMGSSQPL
jgi:hypothetical protein